MSSPLSLLWTFVIATVAVSSVLLPRAQSTNASDVLSTGATVVPGSVTEILQRPPSLDSSRPASHSTTSNDTTLVTPTNKPPDTGFMSPPPHCNGTMCGFNLNPTSCHEAWNLIPRDTIARTFGQRETGEFDIALPYRYLSCSFWSFLGDSTRIWTRKD